ncbi:hypothetical protein KGF56_003027 [Candida oxycetoniae]|uniref:Dynactin subunit 2 n=1 Tax=Candida oxycetoniae TaxID=497107 RepID=A0AAI9SW94_9ASCO|nr:uncharacterized protein KGF56_003027 [Candida oxycetoniae]KAI3404127.1 hypothetical protein KGF56_003027 [Candida oxycetoniae]
MYKFNELPGIDTNSQEVFETSDTETETERNVDELGSESSEIENVNFEESRKQFLKSIIINSRFDFSGNVTNLDGYQVKEAYETKEAKIARIKRELEELTNDDRGSLTQEEICNLSDILLKLKNTTNEDKCALEAFQEEELNLDAIFSIPKPATATATAKTNKTQEIQQLADFEKQLSSIEKLIGIEAPQRTQSIQFAINEIKRRLDVIEHPEYSISVIEEHIESLFKEINKLELSKKVFGIEEEPKIKSDKIDNIYTILPNLKNYAKNAPALLQRLKTLNNIHSEVNETIKFAKGLDQMISDLIGDMHRWDDSMNQVNRKLDDSRRVFDENQGKIESRVDELMKSCN